MAMLCRSRTAGYKRFFLRLRRSRGLALQSVLLPETLDPLSLEASATSPVAEATPPGLPASGLPMPNPLAAKDMGILGAWEEKDCGGADKLALPTASCRTETAVALSMLAEACDPAMAARGLHRNSDGGEQCVGRS